MEKIKISLDEIQSLTEQALVSYGAADWVANSVAKAVRTAEAKGNLICGLYYLESYCQQLQTGRVNGSAEPVVTLPKSASVHVDAKFGFAQAAFEKALPLAIETANSAGTASLSVAHAHTCTSLGYFTEQIAQAGLLAIGFTNASSVVSPPGGKKAVLGTNPIAMSVPAPNGKIAFQFDQSTSAIALGKITMAKAAGGKIPLGWAVDSDGNPTTDPVAALSGSLVSSGGYKGWGFGLMAEVLASALTASQPSTNVAGLKLPEGPAHDLGQFYLLIDPSVHNSDFHDRIVALADTVTAQEGARLPGANFKMPKTISIEAHVHAQLHNLSKGPK